MRRRLVALAFVLGACSSPEAADSGTSDPTQPPVWELSHSVVADVPLEVAWGFQSNVENWERVEGDAVDSIRLDGPFQTGTRGATWGPNQPAVQWRLLEVEPPTRFVSLAALPEFGADLRVTWEFEAIDSGRTRLIQTMALFGPGADSLVAPMDEIWGALLPGGMQRVVDAMARAPTR